MSKTYCRFCDITVEGIYLNCPRCGNWLLPHPDQNGDRPTTPPEEFTLVSIGESWQFTNGRGDWLHLNDKQRAELQKTADKLMEEGSMECES